jgi:murein L,D-transpeptidase YafK
MRSMLEMDEPEIVIRKSARRLDVYEGGNLVNSFSMVLGFAPDGDKELEGDGRTPEGEFYIVTKNSESKFHLSLGLSYPSKDDAARGLAAGVITETEHARINSAIDAGKMPPQKTALGGEIYIHGGGTETDWTHGCIAMKNEEVEELFRRIPVGTRVTILP